MTRIALLSDTHGYLDPKVFKYIEECEEVWHAGDIGSLDVCRQIETVKPLLAVYGNIDGSDIRKTYPKHQRFTCEKTDVWITHIGGTAGKYEASIAKEMKISPPALFICGHSHILKVMFDKKHNLLYMNPGAAGIHGFHQVKTMLRFTIDGEKIKDLQVIELGKRA